MARLAIRGHKKRGKEVIEILEMLGGKNDNNYVGDFTELAYHITEEGIIDLHTLYLNSSLTIFTLEEFLKTFPYKVGDRVIHTKDIELEVVKMYWDDKFNIVRYDVQGVVDKTFTLKGLMAAHFLRYKDKTIVEEYENFVECMEKTIQECLYGIEETMKENLEQITLDIPDGYEFFGINDDNKVVLTKKHIQYPKTYEECCEVLFPNRIELGLVLASGYNHELLEQLGKLLICRNAYWKIAGEEMGLGKPWEPDYNEESYEQGSPIKYVIYYTGTCITKERKCTPSYILTFPTEEMRDTFFENFKSLIEECKELL